MLVLPGWDAPVMSDKVETEEEHAERLRRFVLGVCDGTIFTSLGLSADETRTCFMVLAMCEPDQLPKDIVLVWEYMHKAAPRSINGMPCFFSCHFMDPGDWERVRPALEAEAKRRKQIKV